MHHSFPTDHLDKDEKEAFNAIVKVLQSRYSLQSAELSFVNFEAFEALKTFELVGETAALQIADNAWLMLATANYSVSGVKTRTYKKTGLQLWGVAQLQSNYGHLFIRHETFADKLSEMLQPLELDFDEDKTFSKKFYVLAKDKLKAQQSITPAFRSILLEHAPKNFTLEIHQQQMIITMWDNLSETDILQLATLTEKLSRLR